MRSLPFHCSQYPVRKSPLRNKNRPTMKSLTKLFSILLGQLGRFLHVLLEDPVTTRRKRTVERAFGTFLVLLSCPLIYMDKIAEFLEIQVDYEFQYYFGLDTFLWTIGQTLVVLVLLSAFYFRPYKWALLPPLFVFSVQISYVFKDEYWIQEEYFLMYSIIFLVSILVLICFTKFTLARLRRFLSKKQENQDILVEFVVETRNEHYQKIIRNAEELELLDEFICDEIDRENLKNIMRRERRSNIRKFEIRIFQVMKKIDND